MRHLLLICLIVCSAPSFAQQNFPVGWKGNWKGELFWYKAGETIPKKVMMELRIHPADSNRWNWQIIYGKETEDNRPYILVKKDTAAKHWAIDEKNGIVLDMFLVEKKFSGVFSVMGNTIFSSYQLDKGKLVAEFYSYPSNPLNKTGNGTDESPAVESYRIASYQKAILTKIK